jgi:hypothetical protein
MCTSVEVKETTAVPAVSGEAWVRPIYQPHVASPNPSSSVIGVLDASGSSLEGRSTPCGVGRMHLLSLDLPSVLVAVSAAASVAAHLVGKVSGPI